MVGQQIEGTLLSAIVTASEWKFVAGCSTRAIWLEFSTMQNRRLWRVLREDVVGLQMPALYRPIGF